MRIFIAGICGTFMAGVAVLARERGFTVSGCDANVYPPMSDQLRAAGIELLQGYDAAHLDARPDMVVIGNALSRGNPLVERVLDEGMPYQSGPQWLYENILHDRHVIAVSGTHGKTTTTSMLAWALEQASGARPGFLIGGVPQNFGVSARLGDSPYFVIEADEYDTAFFDKRSKFVHYRPRTLVINNIEFDHADIFADLAAIQRQFHHLVRTVPGSGLIVHPAAEPAVEAVLAMGNWSRTATFSAGGSADWQASLRAADGTALVLRGPAGAAELAWGQRGQHNVSNALAVTAALAGLGLPLAAIAAGLGSFAGVKRRMELVGTVAGIAVYDDFAHHPTAIQTTLEGLRAGKPGARIVAVIEPRSNTMRMGVHRERLPDCTAAADRVIWFQPPGVDWDLGAVAARSATPSQVFDSTAAIIDDLLRSCAFGDQVVIMSNGGFEGIHRRLVAALAQAMALR